MKQIQNNKLFMLALALVAIVLAAFGFSHAALLAVPALLVIKDTDSEEDKKAKGMINEAYAKSLTEAEAKAKETADAATKEALKGVQESVDQALKAKDTEIKAATDKAAEVAVKLDEVDKKYEKALTELNRVKGRDREAEKKTMYENIFETLKDNEETIKTLGAQMKNKGTTFEMKAVGVMSVPSGSVAPDFLAPVGIAHEMVHARNAIPVSPTQSNLIKYNQFTIKEGSIGVVAAGAAKPQFDWTITPKEAPVRKIAGYIQVHDEFLEDIVGSRDFIASELPQALLDVEDAEVFKGDGTGEHLTGLVTAATDLVLPVFNDIVTDTSNAWDKAAAALMQIRKAKRAANAIWVSPEQYLAMLINTGTTKEYTYPGLGVVSMTNNNGQLYLGGVPIYQHTVFDENEGLAGDFARGARIFQRAGAVIRFSTEHGTNFTTNQTTVLIEERIALPIFFPDGFVNIDFTVPAG